jgi:hypothetical protein
MLPPRVIVIKDDSVFSSLSGFDVPHVPTMEDTLPNYWDPQDSQVVSWSYNAHPFLGYVLCSKHFDDPMFQRLSYSFHNVPIQRSGNLWGLSSDVCESWWRLERALIGIANYLIDESSLPMPLDMGACHLPSQFNMDFSVNDERYARKRAMRCITAFYPLMVMVSYAISLHTLP